MPIYVIAGTYRQFEDWRREQPPADYVYLATPEGLWGLHAIQLTLVGEWWRQSALVQEAKRLGLLSR
jgi:hypothetical protein